MALESAGDLAGFFDLDDFAETAVYRSKAGGPSRCIPVILDQPDEDGSIGETGFVSTAWRAFAQADQFPSKPVRGDTLEIGSQTFEIRIARAQDAGRILEIGLIEAPA